jgi:uncharacterized membrane protein YjfL (UPF0719 family)
MLWLFSLVIFGLFTKSFKYISQFSFNKQVIQKDIGVAISYSGFLFGLSFVLSMAFDQDHYDIKSYALRVIMKLILALLIIPLFYLFILKIFKIKKIKPEYHQESREAGNFTLSFGLLEGALFFSTAILTTMIVYKINFIDFVSYFYQ